MNRIDEIIEKHLNPKKIVEAAAAGTSLINQTFWDRKPLIYVRNEEVVFSNSWEFPIGTEMSNETRQQASSRGYIIIDC